MSAQAWYSSTLTTHRPAWQLDISGQKVCTGVHWSHFQNSGLQGVHTRQDACQHGVCSSSYPPKDLLIELQPDGLTVPQVGLQRCQSLSIQGQGRLHLWLSWITLSRLRHTIVSLLSGGPALVRALLLGDN